MALSAAITADIVNSTLLSPLLHKRLLDSISTILKSFKFEFYRGDSFQVYIKDPKEALHTALQLRTAARKITFIHDVRISIGIGEINPGLKKLSTSTDEAFVLSGRSFDTLATTHSQLIITSSNETVNHGLKTISYFVDYLFKNLSEKQSEVIFELLADNTQLKAAKKLKKSISTINKHAQAGGWNELSQMLTEYENLISKITNGNHLAD
jgi:hypothetical protein